MDHDVLKLMAHIDQSRSGLRDALRQMPGDDVPELIKRCAAGRLGDMDERTMLLVGMLAAISIFNLLDTPTTE